MDRLDGDTLLIIAGVVLVGPYFFRGVSKLAKSMQSDGGGEQLAERRFRSRVGNLGTEWSAQHRVPGAESRPDGTLVATVEYIS